MSMSELQSGGGGDAIILTLYVLVVLWSCSSLYGTRKLSLHSKNTVKIEKFISVLSVLTAPFYTSFPTLPPPPPLQTPVNVDIQYQVTAYLRTPEHEPESPMALPDPSPTLAYTNGA